MIKIASIQLDFKTQMDSSIRIIVATFDLHKSFSISHATIYLTPVPVTFDLRVPNLNLIIHAMAFGFESWQNKSVLETPQMVPMIKPT